MQSPAVRRARAARPTAGRQAGWIDVTGFSPVKDLYRLVFGTQSRDFSDRSGLAQASIPAQPAKPSPRILLNCAWSIPPSANTGALASLASVAARIRGSGLQSGWLRVGNSGDRNRSGAATALRSSRIS